MKNSIQEKEMLRKKLRYMLMDSSYQTADRVIEEAEKYAQSVCAEKVIIIGQKRREVIGDEEFNKVEMGVYNYIADQLQQSSDDLALGEEDEIYRDIESSEKENNG